MKVKEFLFVLIILLLCQVVMAENSIYYIKYEGAIHNVASSYLSKWIEEANNRTSELIIIELNTPGGYATSMEMIIRQIMSSRTPVVVFIGPSGSKAASAGFFIAMAADIVVMAPGTNTGAAHPVMVPIIPTEIPQGDKDDEEKKEKEKARTSQQEIMAEKVLKDSIAYIKSVVKARGRNIDASIKAVTDSESYSAEEALELGLVEFICINKDEIIERLHEYKVKRLDGSVETISLKNRPIKIVEMSWKDNLLKALANPTLIFLLLIMTAVGIYAEFTHPGAIFPGVIGFVSLILFFFSAQILPIRFVGVLLILVAVILFILEFKITSFGLLTVGGVICMVLGGLLLIDSPIPEFRVPVIAIIPIVLAVTVIISFLTALVIKSMNRKVTTGDSGMIGKEAVVTVALNPAGKIYLMGEVWNAMS